MLAWTHLAECVGGEEIRAQVDVRFVIPVKLRACGIDAEQVGAD
jgi:hypothetical protein